MIEASIMLCLVVRCGVLTVEIEHVDVETLEKLEQQGVDCQPKASTIRIIQVCFFILPMTFQIKLFYNFHCIVWCTNLGEHWGM